MKMHSAILAIGVLISASAIITTAEARPYHGRGHQHHGHHDHHRHWHHR